MKKKDTFSQAVVGLFMLTVLLLLGYFTIVISGIDVLTGGDRVRIKVAFDQVGGLKDHDNVMYRGTKVGTVEKVVVTDTNLLVVASIDGSVVLRTGYRATVASLSMLGGSYLLLEEGRGAKIDATAAELRGETPTDWMRDLSQIAANLRTITDEHLVSVIITNIATVSEKARGIAEKLDSVVARVERGEGTVGKLLSSDETVYNDLRATMADVKSIAAQLNREKMFDDLAETVSNARSIAKRLNRDKTFDDLEAGIAAFRSSAESFNAKEVVAKANELLSNLNAVAEKLRNGEGTLGKLATDREMYDEVNGLIRDVRQVIDNYRDTTPISTFSSLLMGGF